MTTITTQRRPSDLIGGEWIELEGDGIVSTNPAHPDRVVWQGSERIGHVDKAVAAARAALPEWSGWAVERRVKVLKRYRALAADRAGQIAELICDETGKAMYEARGEAGLVTGKVDITLETGEHSGRRRVGGFEFAMNETRNARCHFRPHGVMGVIGPFNFPVHLPNGHILPALLLGNTIVFKPSDKTPACGQLLVELFNEALEAEGAPAGVVNLVQGAVEVSKKLVAHRGCDGLLFTGSWPVGRAILEANLDQPGKIIALEMGGNNPAIVMDDADLFQAAAENVRCAFNTTGQRCTCTRRLIVHERIADKFIAAVVKSAASLVIDDPRAEPCFAGPVISRQARDGTLAFQKRLAEGGGEVLLEAEAMAGRAGWFVTPSIIKVDRYTLDADDCGCDEEVFGPLMRVSVVGSLDEAIEQANTTRYGLSSAIFTKTQAHIDRFLRESRAGGVNVNTGTAGASRQLPFAGLGWSGNHRPAGVFSHDYCASQTASLIETGDAAGIPAGMKVDRAWLG